MVKRICLLLVLAVCTNVALAGPLSVNASSNGVSINVNGGRIYPDAQPFIKDGRTLVPLRVITENLRANVSWNESSQEITITSKSMTLQMRIGSRTAYINGSAKQLEVAPQLYSSRTFLPLRFLAENMGMLVGWLPETGLATITDPAYFTQMPSNTVLGYTTNDYRGDTNSYSSLLNNHQSISSIATFSYQVDGKGNLKLTGEPQQNTVKYANSKGIKPLVLIHNLNSTGFDKDIAHQVLTNTTNRKNLINNILLVMSREEYSGVNIDIEHINWYDRSYYSLFIKELKGALAPYGFLTTVSIAAKTEDTYKDNNWNGAFDYKEIGKYADQILLMTYDEHYFAGEPGSIASFPWTESVIKYAASVIPPKKLLLGLPGYGYDWSGSGAKVITFKNATDIISGLNVTPQWNEGLKSPYFTYTKNGVFHEVWYENSASISYKLDLVGKYNIGGIGLWKLGYDDESFWDAVRYMIR